jgi:hypothetical protein
LDGLIGLTNVTLTTGALSGCLTIIMLSFNIPICSKIKIFFSFLKKETKSVQYLFYMLTEIMSSIIYKKQDYVPLILYLYIVIHL